MSGLSLDSVTANGLFFQGGNPPLKYFQDCLSVSMQYRRAAGYFSSSVFVASDIAMSGFIERGGKIQIVCSPRLLPEDIESINNGIEAKEILSKSIEDDLSGLLENVATMSATKILGYLISQGQLEIKISTKVDVSPGIFHAKVGIFEDIFGGRSAFCGSTNETWSGWADYGNGEAFFAKSTYEGSESTKDVEDMDNYFGQLWNDKLPNLNTIPFPDVPKEILLRESEHQNLQELIEDLEQVKMKKSNSLNISRNPTKTLMDHQIAVLQSWRSNGRVGIIDHVTGAGKTITAIAAIKEWIQDGKPALVIVPSTLLQRQWISEIRNELAIEAMPVGGDLGPKSKWSMSLSDATRNMKEFGPRIAVAVIGSAVSEDFLKRLMTGNHLMIVGDEVHTLGQTQCMALLTKVKECGAFLGLSAAYERFGDVEGTGRIESVFGYPLKPSFSIKEAIKSGRLVNYDYNIESCYLTELETENYANLSKEIEKLMAREKGTSFKSFSKFLQILIFKRAKIIKQAEGKNLIARKVLEKNYQTRDRWLVYCDDVNQINRIEDSLKGLNLPLLKYYDAMSGDKMETLNYFGEKGGVLLAIKCLDEGIDIPSATHALILASSQNPREYIQRRGRVLRSNPESGKRHAYIFDPVTLTDREVPVQNSELARMISFAQDADNSKILLVLEELRSRMFQETGEWPEYDIENEDLVEVEVGA
jgi:superfamily II DNA or RNA helicase